MLFDLHVHTDLSPCSTLSCDDLLQQAARRGLDGICITDHDTMAVRHRLREGLQENGLLVIFGMEYATADGDFLIFGPFEELAPGLPATDLLDLVRRSGGAAIAAHPFRRDRGVSEEVLRRDLCTVVETVNGRNTPHENDQVNRWRARYPFVECGGSDAHTLHEVGRVVTAFHAPIRSRGDLIRALNQGLCSIVRPAQSRSAALCRQPQTVAV